MKVIDLSGAKAHLEDYAQACQESQVIVTIGGVPKFKLVPIPEDDDPEFIDRLLENNAASRRLAEERRREVDEGRVVSLAEVRRRLLGPE